MEGSEDLYKILGIDHNATQEQIKSAYRKLSMIYHPDRNRNNPEATAKIQKINSTYEILGDEGRRKLYDMKNLRGNMFDERNPVDQNDIFNFLNGNVGMQGTQNMRHMYFKRNTIQKPVSIVKTIELDIEKAYTGCTLPVEIKRMIVEGNIQREEMETLYVPIPEGIDDNEIIILKERGNIIDESNKGDLKIFIRIKTLWSCHLYTNISRCS